MGVLPWRRCDVVGDEVVDESGAECCREAEIVDLKRRGPPRENGEAVIGRVAAKVDQNVDRIVRDASCGLVGRLGTHIDEPVCGGGDLLPVAATIVAPVRIGAHLEARPVMTMEQRADELPYGVVPEVAREVRD